jgi:RPA family protein
MAESQIRQTAYKVWIADLANGEYINPGGEWVPNYVQVNDKKVSRVNIIANSIAKFQNEEGTYISLTLDDGSDNITLKVWNEDTKILEDIGIGDMILTIARVRQYNNQIYLVPEIVKKLEKPDWMILRKKELMEEYGERVQAETVQEKPEEEPIITQQQATQQPVIQEETIQEETVEDNSSENERQTILNLIAKTDTGEGVEITQIATESNLDEQTTNSLIQDLLKEGEIFEIKPGKIKLIE